MEIIPPNSTELTTISGADWADSIGSLSALSPQVALNQHLGDLVQTTLTAAAGDSENTTRAYQTAIGLFLAWLSEKLGDRLPQEWQPLARALQDGRRTVWEYRGLTAALRVVTAGSLDEFAAWRSAEGDGKQTVALRRRAVSTFLRVALREGVMTQEQAVNLGIKPYKKRERKDEKPVGRRLTPGEVRTFRAIVELQAKTEMKACRDRAILDLMLFAALRRAEISGYRGVSGEWKQEPLKTSSLRQDGGRWWLVLTGKGQKTRRIKVHDTLFNSLESWAKRCGMVLGAGDEILFSNLTKGGEVTGNVLNASVIGRLVAEYGAAAGLAPRHGENCLSPHDLRRTCARNAYDNGATVLQVQQMLGHSDPKTTTRYIGALEDDSDTATDYVRY